MIIALDGPAASGKGTLGKRIAAHYGLRHLDTGLLYRAVAQGMLDAHLSLEDADRAAQVARRLDPEGFDEAALKSHAVGEAASIVSAFPEVRAALLQFQRDFVKAPPGAVLDGRDVGTVVCPQADVKIFVVASPEARARRRTLEMLSRGEAADEKAILADIERRDERDRTRKIAPLLAAQDAITLDTTDLDVDATFRAAIAVIEERSTARSPRTKPLPQASQVAIDPSVPDRRGT
ncbi:MAG: CMP/dCMP kinase [Variibacter sp.]|nr:CMP/dCMP kinase [Variibacter sp.]